MAEHRAIALIRGINVGGSRKLPMADLRSICEAAGCTDVATYIQSGNVVLTTALSDARLAAAITTGIEEAVGFQPAVVVRRPNELRRVIDEQPFGVGATPSLHVGFLGRRPTAAALRSLDDVDYTPEEFRVVGTHLYLHLPGGVGRSPLLAKVPFERLLGVDVTVRNWRTVTKLTTMAEADVG